MKKLPYIIFALIFCIMPLTGCTDTSNSLFVISQVKPWSNADLTHEKCEYDYEKLDKNGEAVATGKYVVEISVDKEVTTIASSLTIKTEQGWTDQVISTVKCDSTTLSPHSVNKKINNFAYDGENKLVDRGYDMFLDYKEKTASFSFHDPDAERKDDIVLPDLSAETFDSDQYYQIVRSAKNLDAKNNSGTFSLLSGADSFIGGAVITFPVKYIVGEEKVVTCKKLGETLDGEYGVSKSGSGLCRWGTVQINASQSGSTTTLMFASASFGNSTDQTGTRTGGKNVLVSISRPQYSVSSFAVEFTHKYTLCNYTAY